jgi:hypothetical protein
MDTMDRRDLEVAAAKVTYLRGLLALPLGAVFVFVGVGNLGWWGPLRHTWVFLTCLAVAGLAWRSINRYYNDHFGRVTPGSRPRVRYVIPWTVFPAALVGGPILDGWLELPVSLFAALFALAMLSWYALCVQLRAHHVAIWGALLLIALLPVWGSVADPISVAFLPIGAATMLTGALDHRSLVRGFGSAGELDVVDSHAGA